MFEYHCKLLKVLDGDTYKVDVDLGFGIWIMKKNVRIEKIDTPEKSKRSSRIKRLVKAGKDNLVNLELKAGKLVKQHMFELCSNASKIIVKSSEHDKFGRILGNIHLYFGVGEHFGEFPGIAEAAGGGFINLGFLGLFRHATGLVH